MLTKSDLQNAGEELQDSLDCYLDGLDDELVKVMGPLWEKINIRKTVLQIVVNKFSKLASQAE